MKTTETTSLTRAAAFNEAVFLWCVQNARRCLGHGDHERALQWGRLAAKSAIHHGFGVLASAELEAVLIAVAQYLPRPATPAAPGGDARRRWLHVLDAAYALGGHTILLARWIEFDSSGAQHSVILLAQDTPVPEMLVEAARGSGGRVHLQPRDAPLIERAAALRTVAWNGADAVVLHTHPHDVIATAAFGVPGGPPVMLLNHQSQNFWVGGSVADLVLNLRDSAFQWSERYRGISRNTLLPIPVVPRARIVQGPEARAAARGAARARLGLPADATVLLTSGNTYKYRSLPGLDFLEALEAILTASPRTYGLAVGPRADGGWNAVRARTGGRLLAVGPQRGPGLYHAAADLYLEGFPVGSPTALLEVGILGVPCVRAPRSVPPPFSADGVALRDVAQPSDVADYVKSAQALIQDADERERRGAALAAAIEAHHSVTPWRSYLEKARSALTRTHAIHPLTAAQRLPPEVLAFILAKSRVFHAEDSLIYTWRAARRVGLSPGRHVDPALVRVLMIYGPVRSLQAITTVLRRRVTARLSPSE